MSSKGYKHTKAAKKRIGLASKGNQYAKGNPPNKTSFKIGNHPKTEFKKGNIPKVPFEKGMIPWNKGKKLPQYSGKNGSNWKGGRNSDGKGYIIIYTPKHPFCNNHGYVFEHRLIIEAQIGRYLEPKEEVHHLGAKDDNGPQMLMAFISHSAHKRFEGNKIVKPEEIIFDGRKLTNKLEVEK